MIASGVCSLAIVVLSSGLLGQLPEELSYLEELVENPGALVDAARRFDSQQKSLIEWDQELIAEYSQEGRGGLVSTKQDDIRKRVDLIRQTWEFVTGHYPNNARAVNYQGEYLYDFVGDQVKAVQSWQVAVQLDNKLAPAHNNLSIHYFHTGDYKMGLQHLQKTLELDDENPDYLYNATQMYLNHFPEIGASLDLSKEKLFREAMEMSKEAAKLAPDEYDFVLDYAVNFYAGENFEIEVDWEEAAEAWQKVAPVARTDIERFYAFLNEGRAWLRSKKGQNALKPLEAAAKLQPNSDVVAQLLRQARQGSV